jgi:ketosteroid isomerase-like protein
VSGRREVDGVIVTVVRNPLVDEALQAWTRGDWDAFERALAPDVELLWYEPGAWDCHGRDQVMALLRRGGAQVREGFEVRIEDVDQDTLVVCAMRPAERQSPDGGTAATRVTLRDGLIAHLQQYRTRTEALAGAMPRAPDTGR